VRVAVELQRETTTSLECLALACALLAHGCRDRSVEKNEALIKAAGAGDVEEGMRLIRRGADVNARNRNGSGPVYAAMWNDRANMVRHLVNAGAHVDLRVAAYLGDAEAVKKLIQAGKPVNGPGDTPLHLAAARGNVAVAAILLAGGADVNANDQYADEMPLHLAASHGHGDMVELLIAKGARVDVKNAFDMTPLHRAVESGHRETVEVLIKHGANVNEPTNNGGSPLRMAIHRGDRAIIELLVRRGADINRDIEYDGMPLIAAAAHGGKEWAEWFMTLGADVNAKGKDGHSTLYEARRLDDRDGLTCKSVIETLLAHGAAIREDKDGAIAVLSFAARHDFNDLAEKILTAGAPLDGRATGGVLLEALTRGNRELTKSLIQHGADVDPGDSRKDTPLHYVAHAGDPELAVLLLERGADIGARNRTGDTPLHVVGGMGGLRVAELLIANGADVNAKNLSGSTPLHYAARGNAKLAELLLNSGARIEARDNYGQTPLHEAARSCKEAVEVLLAWGADTRVKDKGGQMPMDKAVLRRQSDIVQLLESHRASPQERRERVMASRDSRGEPKPVGEIRTEATPKPSQMPSVALSPEGAARRDARGFARGSMAFAFDLYKELSSSGGNLFFSPYSISTALAMVYGGARGNTAAEMARTLHLSLDQEKLHPAFAELQGAINKIQEAGDIRLSVANSLWPQEGYSFLPEYLSLVETYYGATITPVDFKGNRTGACATINRWVEQKTENRIRELVQPAMLADPTFLVLVNAIYFKGKWEHEFAPNDTQEGPFYLSANQPVQVPLMQQTESFRYAEAESLQILELPYRGSELSMLILLPKEIDGYKELEQDLTPESLDAWRDRLAGQRLEVHVPKFRMELTFQLGGTLHAMGMHDAFVLGKANFAGMDGRTDRLFIGGVIHKAYVDVNEEGTEAAAATAVGMFGGMPVPPSVFRVDHPFLFLIQENRTGSILFMGRVVDPR
jgi:serpin B